MLLLSSIALCKLGPRLLVAAFLTVLSRDFLLSQVLQRGPLIPAGASPCGHERPLVQLASIHVHRTWSYATRTNMPLRITQIK